MRRPAAIDRETERTDNPLAGLEWLTAEDAEFLADAIERIARKAAIEAVAEQKGATRAYADKIDTPAGAAPPAPYQIEEDSRPWELLATCNTAGSTSATFDVLRSINDGATYVSMLYATVTLSAGNRKTQGAHFMWELPTTRTLVNPGTADGYPMQLRVGDMIRMTVTGGTGIQGLSMVLVTRRVHEHVRRGRARV